MTINDDAQYYCGDWALDHKCPWQEDFDGKCGDPEDAEGVCPHLSLRTAPKDA